ncbi:DUF1697 domain-containing protein [Deinococcus radiomollis]|uniref:DUF1697 domain-containing protein n=1 Tax=Deinococcus radiomollis TaxID=468916 RepID=UPI0038912749
METFPQPSTSNSMSSLHVALLRGINVGGHRKVGMAALKALCLGLGYEDVQTYLQSGNVVFRAANSSAVELEAALERNLGFPVGVMVRDGGQWRRALADNPYAFQAAADGSKVHLALLSAEPDAEGLASLQAVPTGPDCWTLLGRTLYLDLPNGAGRTRLDHATLERRLGVRVTVRNWKTVEALAALLRNGDAG